ncbi:hypothetical protein ACP4OV_006624 [Aristida adscensionis]
MDWYAWMCRAGLDPDVALDYALLFARNELAAADLRHLDHDFLATMGVAVAKHRLQIIKLARRDSSLAALPWRATRLLAAAAHRSARSVLRRLRRSSKSAPAPPRLPAPPQPQKLRHRRGGGGGGGRVAQWRKPCASPVAWRGGGKLLPPPLPLLTHVRKPMLTNGGGGGGGGRPRNSTSTTTFKTKTAPAPAAAIAGCLAAPEVCSCDEDDDDDEGETDDGEETPWEAMFQDLKPT